MTVDSTLTERGTRYGNYTDRAEICDALINVCSGIGYGPQTSFGSLDATKRQAIRAICDKLSRILVPCGDPEYPDNWHDIQGYAKLAEDCCKPDKDKQPDLPGLEMPDRDDNPIMSEIRDRVPGSLHYVAPRHAVRGVAEDAQKYCAIHGNFYTYEKPCATCDAILRGPPLQNVQNEKGSNP